MVKFAYDSTKNADLLYMIKIPVLDPFFFLDVGDLPAGKAGKKYVFLDHREFGLFQERNKNQSLEAVLLNPLLREAEKEPQSEDWLANFAWYLLRKYNLAHEKIEVPFNFPLQLADFLRSKGVELISQDTLYPERAQKNHEEIEAIRQSAQKTEKAFGLVAEILRGAAIAGESIQYQGQALTSEFLKKEIEKLLIEEDMTSEQGIIVSTAAQTAIPHHPGEGPIKAHEPIVCDIFPRNRATGYFADITRTFVKGTPSHEIQKMVEAVLKAQAQGIKAVAPGKKAKDVHKLCADMLLDAGYDVGDKGFVHNTGHGVGLEVHEEPRLGKKSDSELAPGNIITIEPGLYYPEMGGVRIEDMVLVTEQGHENLTRFPKELLIP